MSHWTNDLQNLRQNPVYLKEIKYYPFFTIAHSFHTSVPELLKQFELAGLKIILVIFTAPHRGIHFDSFKHTFVKHIYGEMITLKLTIWLPNFKIT